jgi:membrane protein involved in colicin uptake
LIKNIDPYHNHENTFGNIEDLHQKLVGFGTLQKELDFSKEQFESTKMCLKQEKEQLQKTIEQLEDHNMQLEERLRETENEREKLWERVQRNENES